MYVFTCVQSSVDCPATRLVIMKVDTNTAGIKLRASSGISFKSRPSDFKGTEYSPRKKDHRLMLSMSCYPNTGSKPLEKGRQQTNIRFARDSFFGIACSVGMHTRMRTPSSKKRKEKNPAELGGIDEVNTCKCCYHHALPTTSRLSLAPVAILAMKRVAIHQACPKQHSCVWEI